METKVFKSLPDDARLIREEVFVEEQGFEYEFDEIDETAEHIVLYDEGVPIGICRFFYNEEKESFVFGRLAIRKPYRGRSLGSFILAEAEKQIAAQGGRQVILHAQCVAAEFYRKSGYREFGEIEYEEFCPHIWMKKELI